MRIAKNNTLIIEVKIEEKKNQNVDKYKNKNNFTHFLILMFKNPYI